MICQRGNVGWNPGPCGPAPCRGECLPDTDGPDCIVCELRDRVVPAEIVSIDLESLCLDCAREINAEVLYVIAEQDQY